MTTGSILSFLFGIEEKIKGRLINNAKSSFLVDKRFEISSLESFIEKSMEYPTDYPKILMRSETSKESDNQSPQL